MMYLHIGGNYMIDIHRIVAMFKAHPRKSEKSNPLTQYYQPLVRVEGAGDSKVRAYIVTEECIYATPITLETIVARYKRLFPCAGTSYYHVR